MMRLADVASTEEFGRALAGRIEIDDVITLAGPLGAGKTSLARGILKGLGLLGEAPSPSFAIVQPYAAPEVRVPVLHVDLYRLNNATEYEQLGIDDWATGSALLVEWPDRIGNAYWPTALRLRLEVERDGARCLTAAVPAAWSERWPL